MVHIADADYVHVKWICKKFEIKHLGGNLNLYFLGNTSLLADLFKNFGNMYLEIYELDPARFLTAPGLAWQAALRNTKVKLDPLTDIDMLLMVKEGL